MTAVIVGALLALGALAYVLWPLVVRRTRPTEVSPADEPGSGSEENDPAEEAIRRARAQQRVCPDCGPRPEPAARYCSRCGKAVA